ncbi:MAG: hypothetical protein IIB33_06185 [Chloroflexi bacterium]|nr:hypothetical protein [Chloroflexota bacterium]
MIDDERKPIGDTSSLMMAVSAIVEAVLEGQGVTLFAQRPSPWRRAQREDAARIQLWRSLSWNRS